MSSALRHEFYRLFHSKAFYFSIAVGVFFSVWLLSEQLVEMENNRLLIEKYGSIKQGLYYPESVFNRFIGLDYLHKQSQTLYMLFPILASIPYSASYCIDKKSGYLKNLLTRERKNNYFTAKFITVFFSGFFVVFITLCFSLVITMMFFPLLPPEALTAEFPAALGNSMFKELFIDYPLLYTFIYILIDSAFFGLIAVISMTAGMITSFSFVSLSSGTILYYFVSYIISALKLNSYNPSVFLIPFQPYENIRFTFIAAETAIIFIVCIYLFLKEEAKKDVL